MPLYLFLITFSTGQNTIQNTVLRDKPVDFEEWTSLVFRSYDDTQTVWSVLEQHRTFRILLRGFRDQSDLKLKIVRFSLIDCSRVTRYSKHSCVPQRSV